ncbi:MAG: RNase adapter RapZ [Oscillospiraceae bacterium]|nr:RNase adapter RapZ [Oscillospiraceae bacterium]
MEVLIISGLSGAGKTQVAHILEDMGYYCVDNMPMQLLPHFAELSAASKGRYEKVALVTDIRAGHNFESLFSALTLIRAMNCATRIAFVEARPEVIIRRYKETRRRHPLARDGEGIEPAVLREYELMSPVRARAEIIVDTSELTPATLRRHIAEVFTPQESNPTIISVVSFGFKYGLPPDADIVHDVRFLPNPYYIEELRDKNGLDPSVSAFVEKWPQTGEFLRYLYGMTDFLLPLYAEEGKTQLVIAVGCTGGRHRSVAVAQALHAHIAEQGCRAGVTHRDMEKP